VVQARFSSHVIELLRVKGKNRVEKEPAKIKTKDGAHPLAVGAGQVVIHRPQSIIEIQSLCLPAVKGKEDVRAIDKLDLSHIGGRVVAEGSRFVLGPKDDVNAAYDVRNVCSWS